jgi:signal transduction histidine kinase
MFANFKIPAVLVLIVLLLTLLGLLGWLQYRLVGQVSQGQRERMRENLRAEAAKFGEAFDRELARVYLSFQMDAATLRDKSWQAYDQRYAYWENTAPHPRLVKAVFLVDQDEKGQLRASKFNRARSEFEPQDWPDEFSHLRQQFEQQLRVNQASGASIIRNAPELVAEEIPALVIPVSNVPALSKQQKPEAASLYGYTVVTLDQDYLNQQFIPSLARQYFSGDGKELDYNLTIISRQEPQKIIYQSDSQTTRAAPAKGDAAVNILGVELNSFLSLSVDRSFRNESLPGGPGRLPLSSLAISIQRSPDEHASDPSTLGSENGHWQLILTHRVGSLEEAVAHLRRQNLIISFSILLLLGFSVVMILINAQRAQRLARQQMEFVAGVTHELRTPLSVIYSAGENLADGLIDDRQQVRRYGSVIRSEGRRLNEMVEQVLEFAGMQSGRRTYELRPTRMRELIESALAEYEPLIREKGFQVEKSIAQGLPQVMADQPALKRSLQNLISNAMKYSGDQRVLKIKATSPEGERSNREVCITVEDQGSGIEPADLPHIFEPFYRGREAKAAQIRGSGLGLSLVKHIIEAHGGNVSVKSAPQSGSAFTVHLPAADEEDGSNAQPMR